MLADGPLTRIAPDDAEPVIGRALARPVGIARSNPRNRGEVNQTSVPTQLKAIPL
jgi:hypothetical protein